MSADPELDSFIASLSHQLETVRRTADDPCRLEPERVVPALEAAGAVDLARDTAELPNPLHWLSSVVVTCAGFSPSIAFALAARYAAQRVAPEPPATAVTAAVALDASEGLRRATVPAVFAPEAVVLLDRVGGTGWTVPWTSRVEEESHQRTGLKDADLRTVTVSTSDGYGVPLSPDGARMSLSDLDLLHASVALGVMLRAVTTSEEYASNRRQFGGPIRSYAGLAAILVEMRLRAAVVASLLAAALEGRRDSAELVAVSGRASVDTCLEAIQVHGGYGYIDEYPVAGLLRDAVSLRARGGGRRGAMTALAGAHLPSV